MSTKVAVFDNSLKELEVSISADCMERPMHLFTCGFLCPMRCRLYSTLSQDMFSPAFLSVNVLLASQMIPRRRVLYDHTHRNIDRNVEEAGLGSDCLGSLMHPTGLATRNLHACMPPTANHYLVRPVVGCQQPHSYVFHVPYERRTEPRSPAPSPLVSYAVCVVRLFTETSVEHARCALEFRKIPLWFQTQARKNS